MKKIYIILLMIFGIHCNSYASNLIKQGESLPLSMQPISEPKIEQNNIKNKLSYEPISDQSDQQINKLKKNSSQVFDKISSDMNSPTIEIDGKKYNRKDIIALNGGQIDSTPIISKDTKKKIVLPSEFTNLGEVPKWVAYNNSQQEERKNDNIDQNTNKIARPTGYYSNGKKNNYVDSFFDKDATNNNQKDEEKIKNTLSNMFDDYGNNKTNNPDNIKSTGSSKLTNTPIKTEQNQIKKDDNISNSFNNIVNLYSDPNRKDTVGFINNDSSSLISTPTALRNHKIPKNLLGEPVYIRIFKSTNSLELYLLDHGQYKLANVYNICTFSGGLGPKRTVGDSKSPEGFYFLNKNSLNPHSGYDKAMNVGYPNEYDRSHGYTGSLLMIHGGCKSIGCYAMTDDYIQEIYSFVLAAFNSGQSDVQVDIYPFKMNEDNMRKYKNNPNYNFWKNIKAGYDIFEKTGRPPIVSVRNKQYIIN